jgi:uncharacterized DUF497 family protein
MDGGHAERFSRRTVKAAGNRRKHRATFEVAATVLADEEGDVYRIDEPDDENSVGEDRFQTWGSLPTDRSVVLLICWTDRSTEETRVTRIISARLAGPRERRTYAEKIREP